MNNIIITTTPDFPGKQYEVLGMVMGSVVRAKHIGKSFLASMNAIGGGEITIYTELLNEARTTATQRMVAHAHQFGADAIINARYQSCSVMDGSSEVVAYGTAIKFIG